MQPTGPTCLRPGEVPHRRLVRRSVGLVEHAPRFTGFSLQNLLPLIVHPRTSLLHEPAVSPERPTAEDNPCRAS